MSHPVELIRISKRFKGRPALSELSLEIRANEILGLLGPNGAGKSTIVRTIMGRVAPDSGSVTLFGDLATAGDTSKRSRIGFVPQEIAVYPLLTVRENLDVFARYNGLSGSSAAGAIDKALEWSALADRAGDVVKTLSGGMKRRLNIAAGTLHKPDLLLLDEPTVGVDPQSREKIYSMIEQLRAEGVSILYTTHYMEEAERLCDRISVVDQGAVIAEGTRDELVRSTLGDSREIRISCDAPITLDARAIASHELLVDGNTVRFTAEETGPKLARVLGLLGEKNSRVVEVRTDQRSLEEVFLQLTGRGLRE